LQLESLREDRSRGVLGVDSLIATGMLPGTHFALACHLLAAGHFGLAHLAHVGGAGDGWQQRPGKQDGSGKPAS